MTGLVKRPTRQLALPLESVLQQLDVFEQVRSETVAVLADLLLKAMGEESQASADEQGVRDEL